MLNPASPSATGVNSTKLAEQLVAAIRNREFGQALDLVSANREEIVGTGGADAVVADCLARLLDRDRSLLSMVESLISRLENTQEHPLSVAEVAHLELARGLVAMHHERFDDAIDHIEFARRVIAHAFSHDSGDSLNGGFASVAAYYLARCHYKRGNYDVALRLADETAGFSQAEPTIAALLHMIQAWILFQRGDLDCAKTILSQAAAAFRSSDPIDRCNVLAFEARILRRSGKYEEAITKFREAILTYDRDYTGNPGGTIARCYAQLAYANLLHARRLELVTKRRDAARTDAFREAALENLNLAERICQSDHYDRILARVQYFRAQAYLDMGQLKQAQVEAKRALTTAERIQDRQIMGHVLITNCMLSEDPITMEQSARKAVECADRTDDRRLKARSRIWLSRVFLQNPIRNLTIAKQLYSEAAGYLISSDEDYLREEFDDLQAALEGLQEGDDDLVLKMSDVMSQGLPETLKRVEMSIVIHVLKALNGNISKTAQTLGISRNTVRRALDSRLR